MRTAVVCMPATSDPAEGSVTAYAANCPSSMRFSQCRFCSSLPATISAIAAISFSKIEVAMPAQPHPSSSATRHPSTSVMPLPPYAAGMFAFTSPSSRALSITACGNSAVRSCCSATGIICSSAKSCASCCSIRCSSVRAKPIPFAWLMVVTPATTRLSEHWAAEEIRQAQKKPRRGRHPWQYAENPPRALPAH